MLYQYTPVHQQFSLYIHLPWCVKKCPYCDFNSHVKPSDFNNQAEQRYIDCLIRDWHTLKSAVTGRKLLSIFFGGGTPSLFSASALERLLKVIHDDCAIDSDCEITLEANPGSSEQQKFRDFRTAGINRLSIGVQSFNDAMLKRLGRIHDSANARSAIAAAQAAGFDNVNIDLMYGLPQQTIEQALADLQTACDFNTCHLSWYQLTLEPNTVFYRTPPTLPNDDILWEMNGQGLQFLQQHGFLGYEISAYSRNNQICLHNINYWGFGDYLGLGAGAHSKLTSAENSSIQRLEAIKHPTHYMNPEHRERYSKREVSKQQIPFEFMLNRLRLYQPLKKSEFLFATGLNINVMNTALTNAVQKQLLAITENEISLTELGRRFYNDLVALFL